MSNHFNFGRKRPDMMGDNNPARKPGIGEKISSIKKGVPHLNQRGEKAGNWKGGKPKCEVCQKIISYGRKRCKKHHIVTEKMRRNIGNGLRGEKNYNWQGGITPIHSKIRNSLEMKLWRKAVFQRDNWTCVWCGNDKGGNLEADHIKPFAHYPELRFAIDNGRTLCKGCHRKTDTWGWKSR